MARPEWFAFYPADYDDDTLELSLEEDGLYGRMLRRARRTSDDGSLPNDRIKLCRVLGIAAIPRGCEESVIQRYWRIDGDRLFNPRARREAEAQRKRIEAAAESGRKGGVASSKRRGKPRSEIEATLPTRAERNGSEPASQPGSENEATLPDSLPADSQLSMATPIPTQAKAPSARTSTGDPPGQAGQGANALGPLHDTVTAVLGKAAAASGLAPGGAA